MGIATDILNLRHNRISSMTMLISAIERYYASTSYERAMNRRFQVEEAVDLVLTNVAAHAAEALVTQQPITGRTQRIIPIRKNRRFKSGPSTQRHLFAVRSAS
jgi:hypothetical protein